MGANSSSSDGTDVDAPWPEQLKANEGILSADEARLAQLLVALNQTHLFADWDPPGTNDAAKHAFFAQVKELDEGYAGGGLKAYILSARKLLADAQTGANPLDGWTPSVPHGATVSPLSTEYNAYEQRGLKEIGQCGFVLVAGGLGERLGYHDIKVGLPTQTITHVTYLEFYCRNILEIERRYAERVPERRRVPLAIMVSDDTWRRTLDTLIHHNYYGLERNQITILRQKKVAALSNSRADMALAGPYTIDAKPHGHGDVHSLMAVSGTAEEWLAQGVRWAFFFQDTNALAFLNLPTLLGVSAAHKLEVNSLTVPRFAKQAVGAIANLTHTDGRSMTVNVEYNQLDPLLRATGSAGGDVNDPATGCSPFPGNTNQLLFRLEPYVATLQASSGAMPEFVNPKYADAAKSAFKKPTRLECMMQDYPKLLGPEAKVGFTTTPGWACYSPCKNNAADAAASAAAGVPAAPPFTAESDQYFVFAELLRRMGASVPAAAKRTVLGVASCPGPCIVPLPETVLFPSDLRRVFPYPSRVFISSRSVLVLDGDVRVSSLRLNGALRLSAEPGVVLSVLRRGHTRPVDNAGYQLRVLSEAELKEASDVVRMRGYEYVPQEVQVVEAPPPPLSAAAAEAEAEAAAAAAAADSLVPSSGSPTKRSTAPPRPPPIARVTIAEAVLDARPGNEVIYLATHHIDPELTYAEARCTLPDPLATDTDAAGGAAVAYPRWGDGLVGQVLQGVSEAFSLRSLLPSALTGAAKRAEQGVTDAGAGAVDGVTDFLGGVWGGVTSAGSVLLGVPPADVTAPEDPVVLPPSPMRKWIKKPEHTSPVLTRLATWSPAQSWLASSADEVGQAEQEGQARARRGELRAALLAAAAYLLVLVASAAHHGLLGTWTFPAAPVLGSAPFNVKNAKVIRRGKTGNERAQL